MSLQIGQQVIWLENYNLSVKGESWINVGTVAKVNDEHMEVYLVGEKDPRLSPFIYPETPECRAFLQKTIDLIIKHKLENDLLYLETLKFNHELRRQGLR